MVILPAMAKTPAREGDINLTAFVVTKLSVTPLGSQRFRQMPRAGEWVEIQEPDGAFVLYEVLMVTHTTARGTADVHLRRLADPESAVNSLRKRV